MKRRFASSHRPAARSSAGLLRAHRRRRGPAVGCGLSPALVATLAIRCDLGPRQQHSPHGQRSFVAQ